MRLDISVKRTVADKNWHAGKGMAKGGREEVVKLNNHIEKLRSSIVECYQELHLQKKLITVGIIKEKVMGDDQKDFTLCKLIETTMKNRWVFLLSVRYKTIILPKDISKIFEGAL